MKTLLDEGLRAIAVQPPLAATGLLAAVAGVATLALTAWEEVVDRLPRATPMLEGKLARRGDEICMGMAPLAQDALQRFRQGAHTDYRSIEMMSEKDLASRHGGVRAQCMKDKVTALSHAIEEHSCGEIQNVHLYRGIGGLSDDTFQRIALAPKFSTEATTSFSLRPGIAAHFADEGEGKSILFHVESASRGMPVGLCGVDEAEVLVPRGVVYNVVGREFVGDDKLLLHVREAP